MSDFEIRRTLYLHNRAFKPGQEKTLARMGFSDEQKAAEAEKGTVRLVDRPLSASDGAVKLAEEKGVDLRVVTGSGPKGRIYQADVERFLSDET